MMKSKIILMTVAVGLALGFSLSAFADGIPADKAEIKIDLIPGKKGVVKFPHKMHATTGKIKCVKCHHTATKGEKPKACSACHVKATEAQKEFKGKKAPFLAAMKGTKVDKKSVIFHQLCKDCHKGKKNSKGDKISSCKTCHAK